MLKNVTKLNRFFRVRFFRYYCDKRGLGFVDEQYFSATNSFEVNEKLENIKSEEQKTIDILDNEEENFFDEFYFRGEIKPIQEKVEPDITPESKESPKEELNFFDEHFLGQNVSQNSFEKFESTSKDDQNV